MKSGVTTTEFWVTAIVNIVLAVITIAGVRGLITAEEGEAYQAVGGMLATTVAPIVAAIVSSVYIKSRTEVKKAASK